MVWPQTKADMKFHFPFYALYPWIYILITPIFSCKDLWDMYKRILICWFLFYSRKVVPTSMGNKVADANSSIILLTILLLILDERGCLLTGGTSEVTMYGLRFIVDWATIVFIINDQRAPTGETRWHLWCSIITKKNLRWNWYCC